MNLIQLWRLEHIQAKEDGAIHTATGLSLDPAGMQEAALGVMD
jgi:hypothetical protein